MNPQLNGPLLGNYWLSLRNMMNFCWQKDSIIISPRPTGAQLKGQSSLVSVLKALSFSLNVLWRLREAPAAVSRQS